MNVPIPEFDAAKSRDLEWAVYKRGERSISLPATIRVRNCGYVSPRDVQQKVATDAATTQK